MKRIIFIALFLMASLAASAQDKPIIPERETVVVDNFTAVPNMTLGLYQYARQCVIDGLSRRRVNVIDVESDGFGRPDIVYPSFQFATGYGGHPYDINRVVRIMNEYPNARWYLTAYVCRIGTRPVDHKSKDKEGKEIIKTDFTSEVELDVYLFDAVNELSEGPLRWRYTYSGGRDPEYAERYAVSNLSGRARSFVTDFFRFKASVIKLGEYNKRGKLQDLYLSCGSDIDVSNGDIFYIYSVSDINGIATSKKLGKVKAREITGRESCRCTVSNGEAEIDAAFKAGETLVAVSDDDKFF